MSSRNLEGNIAKGSSRLFCLCAAYLAVAAGLFANSITGSTTDFSTLSYTIAVNNVNQKGNETNGVVATATFGDGSSLNCTFSGGSCINANNFQVVITPPTSATSSAAWNVFNNRTFDAGTNDDLLTVTIQGIPGLTFFVANTVATHSNGVSGVTASVLYSNPGHTAGQLVGDSTYWGTIALTFGGTVFDGRGTASTPNTDAFLFDANTDGVSSAIADIPEPSTYTMVGLALGVLGFVRFRKKRGSA